MNSSESQAVERLRVLQIVETLNVGGMERMVSTLCRTLDPTVYDVRVLTTRKRGALGELLVSDGIAVDCAPFRVEGADYLALYRLVRYIRHFRPHVVHTHATHALLYGGLAAVLSGVPRIVHTEHGRVFPDKPRLMRAERWLSHRLERYVTVSDELAGEVHRHQLIPSDRIAVIPNGVEDLPPPNGAAISCLRERLMGKRPGVVVGTTARLVWEKGLDVLIRAWARLKSLHIGATLIVAGEGPERPNLERLILELGVEDSVLLVGTVADVASFYRMVDVFVLSSVSEGLPMAILEAMAAGRKIVATQVGGIPEALGNGEAGVLVPPSDEQALSLAIASMFQSPNGRESVLAENARARYEQRFTARVMCERYESLYGRASRANQQ